MGPNVSQNSSQTLEATVDFINSAESDLVRNTAITSNQPNSNIVMTNFKWGLGGNSVLVTGTFTKWRNHIPLYRDGPIWSRTIELERGVHYYKFVVDDEWRFNPEDPSRPDELGNINNFIDTTNYEALAANVQSQQNMSQQGNLQWSYVQPVQKEPFITIEQFGLQAPKLPSHFQRCLFLDIKEEQGCKGGSKEGEKQMQVQGGGNVEQILRCLSKEQLGQIFESSHSLQAPVHVVLNHVRMKEDPKFNIYSISHRFKSKYTTYKFLMYKKE